MRIKDLPCLAVRGMLRAASQRGKEVAVMFPTISAPPVVR
jgi:hypothetical protein